MKVTVRRSFLFFSFLALVAAVGRAQSGTPVVSQAIPDMTFVAGGSQSIDLKSYFAVSGIAQNAQVAQFDTVLGKINLLLLPGDAPGTVANFLSYVNRQPTPAYNNTIIHRSIPGFVVQGGGYTSTVPVNTVTAGAAITNEFKISNTRGTIAMAKLGDNPNSATNQWFFNLADNSANLDAQNGGFTVFGRVMGTGMTVVDAIAAVPRYNAGGALDALPLRNYTTGNVQVSNFVTINTVSVVPVFPATNGEAAVVRFELSGATSSLVTATLNGSQLSIVPVAGAKGVADISVRMIDSNGNVASDTFSVIVVQDFAIARQPVNVPAAGGQTGALKVFAAGAAGITYQWSLNGQEIAGATQDTYSVNSGEPTNGFYSVRVSAPGRASLFSNTAVLGIQTLAKYVGAGSEVGVNIAHQNGNIYDQILLQGNVITFTADPGQVTRMSYIDLSDDIVQVEFSGPGSVTVVLENASGPALPVKYNQNVSYMKGHASIAIVGATANTHLSVFTVGTFTAVNQAIFKPGENYDGVADISVVSIASTDGRFGGVRLANTEFSSNHGFVGLNAPGLGFAGPVNIHNVSASDQAFPVLLTGGIDTGQIGITGGDMQQPNNRGIEIESVQSIRMLAGATSHNVPQPARTNLGRYERNGIDVTNQVIVNP